MKTGDKKLRSLLLSDDVWEKVKEAAEKESPKTTRPVWIEYALYEQLKRKSGEK